MTLSELKAIGLDEAASKRGHNYVTVSIDMDRTDKPVLFAMAGKSKQTVKDFKAFLEEHQGKADNIPKVVCDISKVHLCPDSGVIGSQNTHTEASAGHRH